MLFQTTGLPLIAEPPLGFRFGVVFLTKGILPNPIDVRFKSVTGIGATLETEDIEKSTVTSDKRKLIKGVKYDNLVLERGVLIGSPLSKSIEDVFRQLKILPMDVIVSVLDASFIPVKSWMFQTAYPVSWSVSGIDASGNDVLIEKIELVYSRMSTLSL